MSDFTRVAEMLDVEVEDLRSAMLCTSDAPRVSLTVRAVKPGGWGHYGVREGSKLWQVAQDLDVKPEELRDAILTVKQTEPGHSATIAAKARLD